MRVVLLISFVLFCFQGFSQKTQVFGYVRNEIDLPVPQANISVAGTGRGTASDANGYYELEVPAGTSLQLNVSHASYKRTFRKVKLKEGERIQVDFVLFFPVLDSVTVSGTKREKIERMPRINYKMAPSFTGNVEDLIKSFGLGVSSNNEMSASYSVRGGNFDENLIYVNDIEIYRPFLVRSGQQEGLSFVNSDLVDDIYFSSGGFEARYGDKLASVLDIRYKDPKEFKGSVSASLMGGTLHLEGISKDRRITYLTGLRYRVNSYVLGALPSQGDYKPAFGDGQLLLGYQVTDKWKISALGYYADNLYRFIPQNRETEFGTVNEALRLTVYFDGQEITRFQTGFGAVTSEHQLNEKTRIRFISSVFRSLETESFDVLGAYRLDELERDLGSEEFGEVLATRGIGAFLDHARNRLDALVYNVYHLGNSRNKIGEYSWSLRYQGEQINDRLSEWQYLDSAGYSTPQIPSDQIVMNELIKAKIDVISHRGMGHFQQNWMKVYTDTIQIGDSTFTSNSSLDMQAGARLNYWTYNQQLVFSPRLQVRYIPSWFRKHKKTGEIRRVNTVLRFATGVYHQPPFYRELRDFYGNLAADIRAQQSIHFVAGGDLYFNMWEREFKFTSELYYKMLSDIIPYEVDNVRIRYYAENSAKGYAAGWDFKINGEFIKGIESWATMSFMRTYEDLSNDSYTEYYNSDGDRIVPGFTYNNVITDSATFSPGYLPRPTDQLFRFGIFFQDEMPKWPEFKVHLNGLFGSALPYGPPSFERYPDTLRTPPYRRVDIGFSYQFFTKRDPLQQSGMWSHIKDMWLSLEVFNLLGINNTISYNWFEDVDGRTYAVPNYLTSRRLNLKLQIKF